MKFIAFYSLLLLQILPSLPVPGEKKVQPAIKQFPTSKTVGEGHSSTFKVAFESAPDSVTFLKDGKAVDEKSSRYNFGKEKSEYTFEIPKCASTDVGQYVVRAKQGKTETSAAFSLNVFEDL